jgi:hypothetical protein
MIILHPEVLHLKEKKEPFQEERESKSKRKITKLGNV